MQDCLLLASLVSLHSRLSAFIMAVSWPILLLYWSLICNISLVRFSLLSHWLLQNGTSAAAARELASDIERRVKGKRWGHHTNHTIILIMLPHTHAQKHMQKAGFDCCHIWYLLYSVCGLLRVDRGTSWLFGVRGIGVMGVRARACTWNARFQAHMWSVHYHNSRWRSSLFRVSFLTFTCKSASQWRYMPE